MKLSDRNHRNPLLVLAQFVWNLLPEIFMWALILIIGAGIVWILNLLLDKLFGRGG